MGSHCMTKTLCFISLFTSFVVWGAASTETDCLQSKKQNETSGIFPLSFLYYEYPDIVYADLGKARELKCLVSGKFCTIHWHFEGKPLELEPSSAGPAASAYVLQRRNQSLTITSVGCSDEGRYTCVASNGELTISRSMTLTVSDPISPVSPIAIHEEDSSRCNNLAVAPGGDAVFSCTFYVKNPSWVISHDWYKYNATLDTFFSVDFIQWHNSGYEQSDVSKTEMNPETPCAHATSYITLTLNISHVTDEALGVYMVRCWISSFFMAVNLTLSYQKPEDTITDTKTIWLVACILTAFFLTCVLIWKRHGVDIKLLHHSYLADPESDSPFADGNGSSSSAEKLYDAYIVSSCVGEDRAFVYNILCPSLQGDYRLYLRDRDALPGSVTCEDIVEAMEKSHRCIVVLSSDLCRSLSLSPSSTSHSSYSLSASASEPDVGSMWATKELEYAFDRMCTHQHQIIPLVYRDFEFDRRVVDRNDRTLNMIEYIVQNLTCLRWRQRSQVGLDAWALKRIRLRLPPPKRRRVGSSETRRNSSRLPSSSTYLPDRLSTQASPDLSTPPSNTAFTSIPLSVSEHSAPNLPLTVIPTISGPTHTCSPVSNGPSSTSWSPLSHPSLSPCPQSLSSKELTSLSLSSRDSGISGDDQEETPDATHKPTSPVFVFPVARFLTLPRIKRNNDFLLIDNETLPGGFGSID
ncbi:uncharacterized protein [Diadema antillarum]|uniref:uncharacterized protein n=1 Tax=Diadema antillarum TaxID=105358 RepID=UPI003A857285